MSEGPDLKSDRITWTSSWSDYMRENGIEEYATEEIATIFQDHNCESLIGTPMFKVLVAYVVNWVKQAGKAGEQR